MCGIAGIVRLDGTSPDRGRLEAMCTQLSHRGPDAQETWVEGHVGFGHTRLSIIDLAGSRQPMTSADGRYTVTYNGEVLNYRELREQLHYPWRSDGDTEVLLALQSDVGRGGVERLIGQFAYAMHDHESGTVTLVRDRLGVLPLYVATFSDEVLFASEAKAILAVMERTPSVDTAELDRYLAGRSVPAPATLFSGIRKIPPGHVLTITRSGPQAPVPYWVTPPADPHSAMSPEASIRLLGKALTSGVRRALVADVPVGAYLSGGLDSSLIAAMALRERPGVPLHTFSAGFDDPRTSELHHARAVSRALGTVHHPVTVSPVDFVATWRELTWHRDAPMSEPADVAVARLAHVARSEVKVVLSGEGSDELFAGYPKYRAASMVDLLARLPEGMRRRGSHWGERAAPRRARAVVRAVGAPSEAERMVEWFAPMPQHLRERLLKRPSRPLQPYGGRAVDGDLVRRMSVHDLGWWLSDNLLERGDRMTMAHSVELRPPFLDAEVVDLALAMPSNVKLRGGVTKWVVKQVAEGLVPASIITRPKAGFKVPLASWFRGEMQDLAHDMLTARDSFAREVFDSRIVGQLLDQHRRGRRDESMAIWTLMSLEVWHDVFFKRVDRAAGASSPPWGGP